MSHNFLLKIIALGFLLHFTQWLYLSLQTSSSMNPLTNPIFLTYAGASLITGILLWTIPKVGIIVAILRSIMGIYFAIKFGQFLNLGILFSLTPASLGVLPSLFFLIAIILLIYIAFTGKIYTE